MTRDEAIKILKGIREEAGAYEEAVCYVGSDEDIEALDMAIKALSADAAKKKAELKEDGSWDCPDVDCEECEHIRSVKWCSLAIPNYEEKIDETYKMVHEAFFEGFNAAEEQYKFLIEYVEELDKKSVAMEALSKENKEEKNNGIYIKDMKMPPNCMECSLCYDMIYCSITGTHMDFVKMDYERLDDCPLEEYNMCKGGTDD